MKRPKFKKGDHLIEDCGCEYVVMKAPIKDNCYVVRHVSDIVGFKWNKKQMEEMLCLKTEIEK